MRTQADYIAAILAAHLPPAPGRLNCKGAA